MLALSRSALVVSTTTVAAAVGVNATVAPAAPPVTVVDTVGVAVAVRVRLPASFRMAPLWTSAVVVFTATFRPTEAPTPTAPPAVTLAPAATVLVERLWASISRPSTPAVTPPVALPSRSACRYASVVSTRTFTARAPATPTLLAPAPLVAVVSKVLVAEAGERALRVMPLAETALLSAIEASLSRTPTFTPTAAPTPTLPPTVLASAVTVELFSAWLDSTRAPLLVSWPVEAR